MVSTLALQGLSLLITLPHFIWAAILVALFAFYFRWLPPALWESPRFWILPSLVLSLAPLAYLAQITFEAVQKEKNLDYVRTAQSLGVSTHRIYLKHILKNAFFSLLAVIGPITANLLTGSFIVENIFAIPGLGRQFVNGILNRDYFLVMGTILIYSSCLITLNLTTESIASVLDPRVQDHD